MIQDIVSSNKELDKLIVTGIVQVDSDKKIIYMDHNNRMYGILWEAVSAKCRLVDAYRDTPDHEYMMKQMQKEFLVMVKEYVEDKYPGWSMINFEEIASREARRYPAGLYLLLQKGDIDLDFSNSPTNAVDSDKSGNRNKAISAPSHRLEW